MRDLVRRPLFWIAIAVVAVAAVVIALRARGPLVRTTLVVRQGLEQHIVASGRVRVPTRVQVSAQTAGLVVAVGAVEGQRVAAGDLLVQLDDRAEQAAVAQARAAGNQAKARVEQLRRVGAIVATEGLRQADSNLAQAEAELARVQALVARDAAPAVELERAEHAVAIARAQRAAAEAQQAAAAPMGADSRIALTALMQAEAQQRAAEVRLTHTRIVARQAGEVLGRAVEPGDVVQPARTLMVVAADADAELVFQVDERNLAWIALGQEARASADAYPQDGFDARVSYIAPAIDAARGSVEIRLAVPAPPPYLKPDMTVSIDLTVARKDDVLTVRSDAVRDVAAARPYVLAVEGGRVARREVRLGIRGEGAIEIAGGLDEGAEVILPDGRRLTAGARVRAERD